LGLTGQKLLTTLVTEVVGKIVVDGTPTKRYFDGTFPQDSLNYLDPANSGDLTALVNSLVAFFGAHSVLNCTDVGFPLYTGRTMNHTHGKMGVTKEAFLFFNDAIIQVMTAAGVTAADRGAVATKLQSLESQIVIEQVSFCDKYSRALGLTNKALVNTVVTGVVNKLVAAGAPTKIWFDGTKPVGSLNFLDPANERALTRLIAGLVAFFGQKGVLGCTDPDFPKYNGPQLRPLHRGDGNEYKSMEISNMAFNFFSISLVEVLAGAGVAQADLTTVRELLETTRPLIVDGA